MLFYIYKNDKNDLNVQMCKFVKKFWLHLFQKVD